MTAHDMPTRRVLIVGASRGIGLAVAQHRAAQGDEVLSVSRGTSSAGQWIEADISTRQGCERVRDALVSARALDALLFMGGTWERHAFTDEFDFASCSDEDLVRVLDVNLLAPIRLAQLLAPVLRKSRLPRIVLMGSLSGLDGQASSEVANTASKFGLQGVAQALQRAMPWAATTVINPGNVATPEVQDDLAAGRLHGGAAIAMADLLACVDLVLNLSASATVTRLDMASSFQAQG